MGQSVRPVFFFVALTVWQECRTPFSWFALRSLRWDMSDSQTMKDRRIRDPFLDRRCGDDRREAYELGYFAQGGIERRKGMERRQKEERRDQYVQISQWSSVCANPKSATK